MQNNTDSEWVHMPEKRLVDCNDSLDVRRTKAKALIGRVIELWKGGDIDSLKSLFSENGSYVSNKTTVKGNDIINALSNERGQYCEVHLYVKREIIDAEQLMGSMEAVIRTKMPSSKLYQEKQIAWVLTLVPGNDNLQISNWHVWTDPVWNVHVNSLETPLPHEVWKPAPNQRLLSREKTCEIIIRKIKSYTKQDVHEWSNCVHEEIVMHPPWDMLIGRDTSKKGMHVFFENYSNTQITPLRLIYDETQPGLVVYQQIFKTKNKTTGDVGEDLDFVFIEIADEKIRYWRTYFDTTSSAQKGESTFRQVFSKTVSNRSPPRSPSSSPSSSPPSSSPLSSSPASFSPTPSLSSSSSPSEEKSGAPLSSGAPPLKQVC